MLGVGEGSVFNLGAFMVPIITSAFCLLGFGLAFLLPKRFDTEHMGIQIVSAKKYEAMKSKLPKVVKKL